MRPATARRGFRVFPVVTAARSPRALGLVWPFPAALGAGDRRRSAVVTQAVSPWSEPAAAYARYAARAAKSGERSPDPSGRSGFPGLQYHDVGRE